MFKIHRITLITFLSFILLISANCSKETNEKQVEIQEKSITKQEVSSPNIKVGILSCVEPTKTFGDFQPLVRYLTEETGLETELVILTNSQAFEDLLQKDEIDFMFQDPYNYIKFIQYFNKERLISVLTPGGKASHRGVLITRKDSGIKKLEDLKGKKVLFGPIESASKHFAIKTLLADNGIDIDKDLKDYAFGKDCESNALNVYIKEYDAGAMCDFSFEELSEEEGEKDKEIEEENQIDAHKLTIIGESQEIPNHVWAAHKNTDSTIINKIDQALLNLNKDNPEHQEILEAIEAVGFTKVSDKDYNPVRNLVKSTN